MACKKRVKNLKYKILQKLGAIQKGYNQQGKGFAKVRKRQEGFGLKVRKRQKGSGLKVRKRQKGSGWRKIYTKRKQRGYGDEWD